MESSPELRAVAQRSSNSLFEDPWWLDAVAPGTWRAIEVRRGSEIYARLVVDVRRKLGLTVVSNPPLTQTIGPWLRPSDGKQATRLGDESDLATQLIDALPKGDVIRLTLSPEFLNPHPFHWRRFGISIACTYRLLPLDDEDRVWRELSESCRRQVRKARRLLATSDDPTVEDLYSMARMTWQRQGLRVPFDQSLLARVCAAAAAEGSLLLSAARDASRRLHAAIAVIYDNRSAYYLIGGADPSLRSSGAHSLLMWEAIRRLVGENFRVRLRRKHEPKYRALFPRVWAAAGSPHAGATL